jgi:hypothetical protein
MGRNNGDFRTEYDKSSNTMMTKNDYQQKNGWVSAWPAGHPNHPDYQSPGYLGKGGATPSVKNSSTEA